MSRTFPPSPPRSAALLSGALALFALAQPASAADFCVADATALQAALNAAAANVQADTVKIVQGTYTGPFVYTSSERYALSVLGGYVAGCASRTLDAANTTLQGDGADRVLALTATNGGAFTVEGVTISGGVRTGYGGGLYASTSSNIYLRDNVIQGNTATLKGGGAYIASEGTMYVERNTFSTNGGNYSTAEGGGLYVFTDHGTLAMTGNTFATNVSSVTGGGATVDTYLGTLTLTENNFDSNRAYRSSSPTVTGGGILVQVRSAGIATLASNTFSNNEVETNYYYANGGGAYVNAPSGAIILTGNAFDMNSANNDGGGAYVAVLTGAVTLTGNTYSNNSAYVAGGASVTASTGTVTLADNAFDINKATTNGGGALVSTSTGPATLAGNVFYTNNAAHGGGAYIQTGGIATLTNNTLENSAGSIDGGGLWLTATSETATASLYNNLFWNNHAPTGGDLWINNDSDADAIASPLALMHNNFNQTPSTGYWTKIAITIDPSNLDVDVSPFDDTDTQHLRADSPMIDAGDEAAPALPATDMDGEERVIGATVDIGADEFAYSAYRLTVVTTGTGSGTVTSSPAGINCGTDCTEDYPAGTSVTLTATPAVGSVFTGWSGACTGAGTCNLTMDAAKSVTATFVTICLKVNDVSKAEGNSGTTAFTFTVGLSQASTSTVTVNFATVDGTAKAGSDYPAKVGTLTFTPGQTSKTVTVDVIGDTNQEANETFSIKLSNPIGATLCDDLGIGTILNDDGPVLTINDVSKAEGNSGTTAFTFTVTLKPASAGTVTVNYATANSTATAGSDYTATSGTLTFSPGQISKTVTVPVIGDTLLEPNETFTLRLSAPVGATVFDGVGLGTILNDEGPVLRINNVTKAEGNSGTTPFTFTVSLSPASAGTVTVKYATANGTATAGSDYTAASGALTFAPGQTSQTVTVNVMGDTIQEANETFYVNLSSPVGATLFDGQGLGTILNDDGPVLRINDVSKAEGNSSTTAFTFTVTLSPASASIVTVSYATANGTATVAGGDYLAKVGSLTFLAGQTSQPVTVDVIGDTNKEASETFFVNLSGATGATLFDSQGRGTILDDDNVDFAVTSTDIVLTPDSPVAGGTFTATVTVKNLGTAAGDGGYLDIWLDQATVQTCPADGNAYQIVGIVEAGASKVFTFAGLRSGVAGTKTFRAFVDSYCQTPEANEGNNQAAKSYSVVP